MNLQGKNASFSTFCRFLVIVACLSSCLSNQDCDLMGDIQMTAIDLSTIQDGVYLGRCRPCATNFKVKVSVYDHKIVKIIILHDKRWMFEKKCAMCNVNQLIQEIINTQTLDVDVVSGASLISDAFIRAIFDALSRP